MTPRHSSPKPSCLPNRTTLTNFGLDERYDVMRCAAFETPPQFLETPMVLEEKILTPVVPQAWSVLEQWIHHQFCCTLCRALKAGTPLQFWFSIGLCTKQGFAPLYTSPLTGLEFFPLYEKDRDGTVSGLRKILKKKDETIWRALVYCHPQQMKQHLVMYQPATLLAV